MSRTNQDSVLLTELQKTILTIGMKATIQHIVDGRNKISHDKNIRFVIITVCRQMDVSINSLTNEKNNTDKAKYAQAFIIYFLRGDFQTPWADIATCLNKKSRSYLYQQMTLIKKLKPHLASDQPWINHKNILQNIINEFKTNNNGK